MTKKQQKYSIEFKLEAIELARSSDKTDSQVERELGLGRKAKNKVNEFSAEQLRDTANQVFSAIMDIEAELSKSRMELNILNRFLDKNYPGFLI